MTPHLPTHRGTHRVFVYGTLLTGHGNWSWALAPRQGRPATTEARYMMTHGPGFPYVGDTAAGIDGDASAYRQIRGEVFEVDDETLDRLDRLEGVPTHYERIMVWTVDDDGERRVAWLYVSARLLDGSTRPVTTDAEGRYNWRSEVAA